MPFGVCTETLSDKELIFNEVHKNPMMISNFVNLAAKAYIYSCRCQDKHPNIFTLKRIVCAIRSYERYYTVMNNRLDKHNKKGTM